MDSMTTLDTSLPPPAGQRRGQSQKSSDLLQTFRWAALATTQLYKATDSEDEESKDAFKSAALSISRLYKIAAAREMDEDLELTSDRSSGSEEPSISAQEDVLKASTAQSAELSNTAADSVAEASNIDSDPRIASIPNPSDTDLDSSDSQLPTDKLASPSFTFSFAPRSLRNGNTQRNLHSAAQARSRSTNKPNVTPKAGVKRKSALREFFDITGTGEDFGHSSKKRRT